MGTGGTVDGRCTGVGCRCVGSLFGSGSLSDEDEDDELDESDDALSGVPRAGLSPSGSSRVLVGFWDPDAKPGSLGVVWRRLWYPSVVVHQLAYGWRFFLPRQSVWLQGRHILSLPCHDGSVYLLLIECRTCVFPMRLPYVSVRGLPLSTSQHG